MATSRHSSGRIHFDHDRTRSDGMSGRVTLTDGTRSSTETWSVTGKVDSQTAARKIAHRKILLERGIARVTELMEVDDLLLNDAITQTVYEERGLQGLDENEADELHAILESEDWTR